MVAHFPALPVADTQSLSWQAVAGHLAAALFVLAVAFVCLEVLTFDASDASDCLPDFCTPSS